MKITKKETYGIIDSGNDDKELLECPYCSRYGITAILQYRQNYDAEDKERWRQCPHCDRVLPATSGRRSGRLVGVVDPVDTPFSEAKVTGIGNKKPRTYMEKYRKQLLEKANKETDAEVRREILKGNEVDEGLKHE